MEVDLRVAKKNQRLHLAAHNILSKPGTRSVVKNIAIGALGSGVRFPRQSTLKQCHQQLAIAAMFLLSCVVQALSRKDGSRHLLHVSVEWFEYFFDYPSKASF